MYVVRTARQVDLGLLLPTVCGDADGAAEVLRASAPLGYERYDAYAAGLLRFALSVCVSLSVSLSRCLSVSLSFSLSLSLSLSLYRSDTYASGLLRFALGPTQASVSTAASGSAAATAEAERR